MTKLKDKLSGLLIKLQGWFASRRFKKINKKIHHSIFVAPLAPKPFCDTGKRDLERMLKRLERL